MYKICKETDLIWPLGIDSGKMHKVLKWGIFNIQKGKYGRERGVAGKKFFTGSE